MVEEREADLYTDTNILAGPKSKSPMSYPYPGQMQGNDNLGCIHETSFCGKLQGKPCQIDLERGFDGSSSIIQVFSGWDLMQRQ